jgi:hypothetical protein
MNILNLARNGRALKNAKTISGSYSGLGLSEEAKHVIKTSLDCPFKALDVTACNKKNFSLVVHCRENG